MDEKDVIKEIAKLRSELKADRLDMSFGEIMRLYEEGTLVVICT